MSTQAIIYVKNPNNDFSISFSHDGYPDFVLSVLLAAKCKPGELTYELIKEAHDSKREPGSNAFVAKTCFGVSWDYTISQTGLISLNCYEYWNQTKKDRKASPFDYLQLLEDEYKDEVKEELLFAQT